MEFQRGWYSIWPEKNISKNVFLTKLCIHLTYHSRYQTILVGQCVDPQFTVAKQLSFVRVCPLHNNFGILQVPGYVGK